MQNLGIDQDFFQAAGDLSESPRGSVAQPSHIASPRGEFMGRSFRPSDIRCPGTREILKIMLDEEWGFLEAEAFSLEGFGGWKLHGLVKPDTVSLGIGSSQSFLPKLALSYFHKELGTTRSQYHGLQMPVPSACRNSFLRSSYIFRKGTALYSKAYLLESRLRHLTILPKI
ncbi:UNVERIFIED_CONTAM: hypothetical protein Sradi_2236500 [Sesamum radiatum]|uniref:Uncharacterized protein n=1 Tax=Sesamum radiatum TaxID=300843 RepID=A0AAW2T3M2_SESRA